MLGPRPHGGRLTRIFNGALAGGILFLAAIFPVVAVGEEPDGREGPVIEPSMGPLVTEMFRFECAWNVNGIHIDGNRVLARITGAEGTPCDIAMIHPESGIVPGGGTRYGGQNLDVVAGQGCPAECVAKLVRRVREMSRDFVWTQLDETDRSAQARPHGRSGEVLVSTVGIAVLLILLTMGIMGTRRFARMDGAPVAAVFLFAAFSFLVFLSWWTPYESGDELVDFTSSLTGLLTGFDLVDYPHPTLYFNLSTALYGVFAAGYSLFHGLPLHHAYAHVVLHHHTDLLFLSRVLTALCWASVMGGVYAWGVSISRNRWTPLLSMVLLFTIDLPRTTTFSPSSLGVLLSYLFVYRAFLAETRSAPGPGRAAILGLLGGAAVSAHYLSMLFMPVFPLALLWRPGKRWWGSVMVFCLVFAAVFLVVNFQMMLNFHDFVEFFRYRIGEITMHDPADAAGDAHVLTSGSPFYYLRILSGNPVAWMALAGLAFGLVQVSRRFDVRIIVTMALPLYLLVALSLVATRYDRYLIFVYPALALLGTHWLSVLPVRLKKAFPSAVPILVAVIVSSILVLRVVENREVRDRVTLGAGNPVAIFIDWLRAMGPDTGNVAVASDYAPSLGRAVSEGRIPAALMDAFRNLTKEATGRQVRWMAIDRRADLSKELSGVSLLYTVDWTRGLKTIQGGVGGLEEIGSRDSCGLTHTAYRVSGRVR